MSAEIDPAVPPPSKEPRSLTWPWVLAFAHEMERKLALNRHKGDREGWRGEPPGWLLSRLREEMRELAPLLDVTSLACASQPQRSAEIRAEAADIANFAMMIADVAGGLTLDAVVEADHADALEIHGHLSTIQALLADRYDLRRRVEGLQDGLRRTMRAGRVRGGGVRYCWERDRDCTEGDHQHPLCARLNTLLSDTPAPRPDPRDARIAELEAQMNRLHEESATSLRQRDDASAEAASLQRRLEDEQKLRRIREQDAQVAREELARYREANRQPLADVLEARNEVVRLRTALREALAGLRGMVKRAEGALTEQPPDGWVSIGNSRWERRYPHGQIGRAVEGITTVPWELATPGLRPDAAENTWGNVCMSPTALAEAMAACDAAAGRVAP